MTIPTWETKPYQKLSRSRGTLALAITNEFKSPFAREGTAVSYWRTDRSASFERTPGVLQ